MVPNAQYKADQFTTFYIIKKQYHRDSAAKVGNRVAKLVHEKILRFIKSKSREVKVRNGAKVSQEWNGGSGSLHNYWRVDKCLDSSIN